MNRKERRALERERLNAGNGYGLGNPNAKIATGQSPTVNPFIMPKAIGINTISNNFAPNYFVEWTPQTWRLACDQAMKQGWALSYNTLCTWAYEASPFIQGVFIEKGVQAASTKVYLKDAKGNPLDDWNKEICNQPYFVQLKKEYYWSELWGFTGLNIDYETKKIIKYPMANVDPINKMLRKDNYNFGDGIMFDNNPFMLFIQPNTNYESFLGYMQPITRSFILMNTNSMNWVQAGRKLAFPLLMVGYPVNNVGLEDTAETNKGKAEAEAILQNADPSHGIVYPYTLDAQGNIIKGFNVEMTTGTQGNAGSHRIYNEFNKEEKTDIKIMVFGETLTSSVGASGSLSLGEIHQKTKEQRIKATNEMMLAWLNSEFLPKLYQVYRYFPEGASFDIDYSKEWNIDEIVKVAPILNQNGIKLTQSFFEKYGFTADDLEIKEEIEPKPLTTKPLATTKKE